MHAATNDNALKAKDKRSVAQVVQASIVDCSLALCSIVSATPPTPQTEPTSSRTPTVLNCAQRSRRPIERESLVNTTAIKEVATWSR